MTYIRAIDGLRAVAVLSVMLFHMYPPALPGGYVGVDVFFVISGFVVTGSLIGKDFRTFPELLGYFYARRLLRIMPALIVVLFATILLTSMFVPEPWISSNFKGSAKSAFFGASNIYLSMRGTDYFAPSALDNPYLHTWSLGVEEQFYLIFPFLFFWHMRSDGIDQARSRFRIIMYLTVLSFLSCGVLAFVNWQQAFYSIVARFWELGVGMLLCLSLPRWKPVLAALPRRKAQILTAVTIAFGILAFAVPETRAFPFPLALLPVGATVVLIALVAARSGGVASYLLSTRGVVFIGAISYSLYLWHWPVFVLFRWTVGLETISQMIVAAMITFGAAVVSYFVIEQPLRTSDRLRQMRRGVVACWGLSLVVGSAAAGTVLLQHKSAFDLSKTAKVAQWYADDRHQPTKQGSRCSIKEATEGFAGGEITSIIPEHCALASLPRRLYSVGDSHNLAYRPMLRQVVVDQGIVVVSLFHSGCPYIGLRQPNNERQGCQAFGAAATNYLKQNVRQGDSIFLPSLRLQRISEQAGAAIEPAFSEAVASRALFEATGLVKAFKAAGAEVIIEAPPPVFASPAFRCSDWFNRTNPVCAGGLTIARDALARMRSPVLMSIDALQQLGADVWDPFPILCPGATCHAVISEGPLYYDGDHISGYANDLLYPSFARLLSGKSPNATKIDRVNRSGS